MKGHNLERGEFLYVASSLELWKVGITSNPGQRLKGLQGHSAAPVRYVVVCEVWSRSIELIVHGHLSGFRRHGEWFVPHTNLRFLVGRMREIGAQSLLDFIDPYHPEACRHCVALQIKDRREQKRFDEEFPWLTKRAKSAVRALTRTRRNPGDR